MSVDYIGKSSYNAQKMYFVLEILQNALELYSKYELLFVRMAFKEEKNKKVKRRRRISIIKACKLSVHSKIMPLAEMMILRDLNLRNVLTN